MSEEYVLEDIAVKMSVLEKLPAMPAVVVWTHNMDGERVMAFIVIWIERHPGASELRKAYFSVETGEYISEAFTSEDYRAAGISH